MTMHVDDRQILRRHRIAGAMQSASSSRTLRGCVGQDSNLGTPSGRDLESLAFDRAWLPTRGRAATAVRKTFPVSIATRRTPTEAFSCGPASGRQRGIHGPILHEGVLRRTRRAPECRRGVGKEGRGHRREDRPHVHGSQRVVPPRHSEWPGRGPRRRARRPRGLQVRRDLRGLDATRERGEGLSRTRPRRANPIPRLHAGGHGPHGPAEPDHPNRATGSAGGLAAAQNAITATRRTPISRTPSRKAVDTNKTVQVCDPRNVTLSGPGTRKWLTIPYTKEATMRTARSPAASGGVTRKITSAADGPVKTTPRKEERARTAGRIWRPKRGGAGTQFTTKWGRAGPSGDRS